LIVAYGDRKDRRVRFATGIVVVLMGIDGTWRRRATLLDISATGARLILQESMAGLNIKEFFVLLTRSGKTFRRCEMVRVNGDELGVCFSDPARSHGRPARRAPQAAIYG